MSTISPPSATADTPRVRRGAAAVVAQYIQDLTHPISDPRAVAA